MVLQKKYIYIYIYIYISWKEKKGQLSNEDSNILGLNKER